MKRDSPADTPTNRETYFKAGRERGIKETKGTVRRWGGGGGKKGGVSEGFWVDNQMSN